MRSRGYTVETGVLDSPGQVAGRGGSPQRERQREVSRDVEDLARVVTDVTSLKENDRDTPTTKREGPKSQKSLPHTESGRQ